MIRLAIIPAAGFGTRLQPITVTVPKELLPLGRKPVIEHVVHEVHAAGIDRVVLITRDGKEQIEQHFGAVAAEDRDGADPVRFIRQQRPDGLGGAILAAKDQIGMDPFVVALGDCAVTSHAHDPLLARMIRVFEKYRPAAVVALERVSAEKLGKYGVIVPGEQRQDCIEVLGTVEKPGAERAPSDLAIAARYVFEPVALPEIARTPPDPKGEIPLSGTIGNLAAQRGAVLGVVLERGERRHDVGNFESYYEAFARFAVADSKSSKAFTDTVRELIG